MKIHNALNEILQSGGKLKILRFLFNENRACTGRGIAAGICMSPSAIHKELFREGVLHAQKIGNAIAYKLNKEAYLIQKVIVPLFETEKSFYHDLVSFVKKETLKTSKKKIATIALFGSVAKEEDTSKSDMDLLIIVFNASTKQSVENRMDHICPLIAKNFGTILSPYVVTRKEFGSKNPKRKRLVKSILENYRLLYGEPLERVIA